MAKIFISIFVLVSICFLQSETGYAQVKTEIETAGIISTSNNTPFWLQSNQSGRFAKNGSQLLTRFQSHGEKALNTNFNVLFGADVIARPGEEATLNFNQGYVKLKGYGFELAAGRFHNSSPFHDEELSSGSLGISNNASPIPQIRIGTSQWNAVPFTNSFVEFQGHLSHGWLGSRRYTEKVLLHEKVFHLRLGGNLPVNLYGGLAHYATWGGKNHPNGNNVPTSFKDYISVFFAQEGGEGTPGPDQAYALGDHLGAWDFGFFVELDDYDIHIYRHFPFEDFSNLMFKSYMDALTGISIQLPENSDLPIDRFLYEYLYTKFQAGPRESRGELADDGQGPYRYNENYYNHYFYRSGWVYNQRTIGSPLFTPGNDNLGIMNNRIVAHHIGFISTIGSSELTTKATFSRNYGKRCDNRIPDNGENEMFGIECVNEVETVNGRSLDQWSFLIGLDSPFPVADLPNTLLRLRLSYDNGSLLGDQFGVLVGVRWVL